MILSGPPCTPVGESYLLIPWPGSGVGVVCWASKARDSIGRRLSLSRLYCDLYGCVYETICIDNIRVNIYVVGKTYEQTRNNGQTDRRADRWMDRKDIRDSLFKWQNPWCHGKRVIIEMYGRMC